MEYDGVTVVIPLRNRAGARLWNCLNSLKKQIVVPREVIVSDLSSDKPFRDEIREMVREFGWTFMCVAWSDERFNKAVVANCGIKRASSNKVILLDVDAVMGPECISYFLGSVAANSMVLADHYRGRAPEEGEDLSSDWHAYAAASEIHEWAGTANGFFMGAYKDFWKRICGVDERFIGWGAEDDHVVWKAEHLGHVVRMKERLLVHQDHGAVAGQKDDAQKNWDILLGLMGEEVKTRPWGEHPIVEYQRHDLEARRPWRVAPCRRRR